MDTAPVAPPSRNTSRRVVRMRGFCQVARSAGGLATDTPAGMLLLPIGDEIDENGVLIGQACLRNARLIVDGDRDGRVALRRDQVETENQYQSHGGDGK